MIIALWIINILLAIAFLGAGGMKLARPKTALQTSGMGFVEDYSAAAVKGIGAVEVVGALGLILPLATGIASILAPIAAAGLAVTMLLATLVHVRRKESVTPSLVLMIFALASTVIGLIVVL